MKRWWGGSSISWTTCKSSAPRSRQITTPAPHHSVFCRPHALPDAQPIVSKHSRQRFYLLHLFRHRKMTAYLSTERKHQCHLPKPYSSKLSTDFSLSSSCDKCRKHSRYSVEWKRRSSLSDAAVGATTLQVNTINNWSSSKHDPFRWQQSSH